MKPKILVLVAMLLLSLAVAACGTQTTTVPTVDDPTEVVVTDEATAEPMEEATAEPMEEPTAEAAATTDGPIVMSFVPSGDTQEIIASGDEIAAMVTEMTGIEVEANVATSYAAVVEAMCAGNAQVGWLNTFSYILANERDCADVSLATVRRGQPYYTGQIIANVDSGIETLADIDGKKMCWVDPLSTSGYIIPRVMLAAAGVDVDNLETQDAGSHPNVVTAVYNGDCDAGATFVDARTAVSEEFPDVNDRVKVITESPQIPNDTVAFSADIPEDVRDQIVSALTEIAGTDAGKAALEQVYEIEGFAEVDDSFYDGFRAELDASGINIEELAQ